MTVRPAIEKETMEKVNEAIEDRMAVSPESVSIDDRLNVLVDELETETRKRKRAQTSSGNQGNQGFQY